MATVLVAFSWVSSADESSASGLIAPKSTCVDQPASGSSVAMDKARQSMTCMVNYARKKKGLRPLRVERKLGWSARRKSGDILRCGFSHSACGRPFDFWIQRSRYLGKGGWSTGENIAWGSGALGNVRSIFVAWMKSKGHREAILSTDYRDVGAGVLKGRFRGIKGARVWVLHFGRN